MRPARDSQPPRGRLHDLRPRQFHQVTQARVNRLLLVPGGDHGVDLLSDENGPKVRRTILAFLEANAG
jgi:hypothetical protein